MLESNTLLFACAANCSFLLEWFRYIKAVMNHPDLTQDEQYLWMWLATHCASLNHHTCSFSYEQISQALEKPARVIHRALFRLKLMGFLNGTIPIWYGELTPEMIKEKRTFRPLYMTSDDLLRQEIIRRKRKANIPIWETYDNQPININLLSKGGLNVKS